MKYFYIECRFHRYPKNYLKGLINEVAHEFRVKGALKYRPVPHMTLYGPSQTKSLDSVFSKIEKVAKRYTLVPFAVCDFNFNKGKTVIGCQINASVELKNLRRELAEELNKLVKEDDRQPWDNDGDYWFHTTIAMKDIDRQFKDIWSYVNEKEKPHISQHLIRITVLNNKRKIEGEYDLVLKRWLKRWQVITPSIRSYWWRKTITRLRELRKLNEERKPSIFGGILNFIKRIGAKKTIYLIGDTHFDHENIIKYCGRPFRGAQEMNNTMTKNWNDTVKERDTVYFLGDYTGPPSSKLSLYYKKLRYWSNQLKGNKISILGNHDRNGGCMKFASSKVLHHKKHVFLLIHDPDQVNNWQNWVIHGHKHNNELKDFPFINGERKTINVSTELLGYQPLSIGKLLSLNIDSIKRMEDINSEPERW